MRRTTLVDSPKPKQDCGLIKSTVLTDKVFNGAIVVLKCYIQCLLKWLGHANNQLTVFDFSELAQRETLIPCRI